MSGQTATLFIGNLSAEATEADLRELVGAFGEIRALRFLTRRGTAFIELDADAAAKAAESLRGNQLKGRTMDVAIEAPRGGKRPYKPGRGGAHRRR